LEEHFRQREQLVQRPRGRSWSGLRKEKLGGWYNWSRGRSQEGSCGFTLGEVGIPRRTVDRKGQDPAHLSSGSLSKQPWWPSLCLSRHLSPTRARPGQSSCRAALQKAAWRVFLGLGRGGTQVLWPSVLSSLALLLWLSHQVVMTGD
jgi:hypothetical protein